MTIKELRKKTGLTQVDFAEKFHVPVQTITQWESGRRSPADYVIYMMEKIIELEQ